MSGEIEKEVRRERETQAVEDFVDQLREKAVIEDRVPTEVATGAEGD